MSFTTAPPTPQVARQPQPEIMPRYERMSLADFLNLPEQEYKIEWTDGWAIFMMAPARRGHNSIQFKIGKLLDDSLLDCEILIDGGLTLENARRSPDIMVFPTSGDDNEVWITDTPIIAVEVISPSSRKQDRVNKAAEYAQAGISQYWIVDQKQRTITCLFNSGNQWGDIVLVNEEHPTAEIKVPGHGSVNLDLAKLLGR